MPTDAGSGPAILPGIVPRWEWRVFGSRFPAVDAVLASMDPERAGTSEETYVLSTRSDASVKVRDGLMDVKLRLDVDAHGLERWAPVLKAAFPVADDDVMTVLEALGVAEAAVAGRAPWSREALLELLRSCDDVLVVAVTKHRTHFLLDGCMVESTEGVVDGHPTRTVVAESEDAALVLDTVRRLELLDHPNLNVARGLKALVGFGSSRVAVIDVGTNSVKYHLEERRLDGTSTTLADRAVVTRLGEGQSDDGVLAPTAVDRTVDTICTMVDDARALGPVEIVAVGTAGLRRAPNRSLLVDAVRDATEVEVEVITGAEEARLAYLAATSALPAVAGALAVFDSGGGSTQFTFGIDGRVDEQFSVDVGAVRIAEEFGLAAAVPRSVLDEVLAEVAARLSALAGRPRPAGIVAIGGTATNLAAVRHGLATYDPDVVHGTVVDLAELDRQIELYRTHSAEERRSVPGLQPARAEVILGGACIVRTVLATLGHDAMTVSDRGLRHGVVVDRFAPSR